MENPPVTTTDIAAITQPCFLIDWLTFTDHFHTTPQEVMSFLGLPDSKIPWIYDQKFRNGYPQHYSWNHITISFGADDPKFYADDEKKTAEEKARTDMGICVEFSGQGCRAFETEGGDWLDLFKRFQGDLPTKLVKEMPMAFCRTFKERRRFNVTRLDLAFDDHSDLLDIHRVYYDVVSRNYVSKSTKAEWNGSDDQKTDIQGLSVGVGSKKSKVYVRIYDKAAERGFKDRHWVRVELQLRDDRALVAMAEMLHTQHIGRTVAGILRNYLTFRIPSADTNKSRWPIAYYWERVIGQMEKLSLWISPGEEYNLSKTEYWLKKQYGQVIATLALVQDPEKIVKDCQEIYPEDKLGKKYKQIVDDFRRQEPLPELQHLRREKFPPHFTDHGVYVGLNFYTYEQWYKQTGFADLQDFVVLDDDSEDIDEIFGIKD